MKKLLLLPALVVSTAAFAQNTGGTAKPVNCAAVQTENAALKEKIVAYEARLGINGTVNTINGNDKLTATFISCKASKSTHKAVFTFMIRNTDEPIDLIIWADQNAWGSAGSKSTVLDQEGKSFPIESMTIGTTRVGYGLGPARVPSKAPVQGSIEVSNVPLSTTNLNAVLLAFGKTIPGMDTKTQFVSGFQNVPVTWVP
ncbi:hypothetical protein [Hymenobacter sp. APR13]|uniref:hypothetical protein n=1 Tax=Hymenobacter sp. APR13 TaxID=1356852 RepID=UPI0004E09930|nr:hypothetical protein [Hymenobacter sp. APR13]AII50853.1 hypothetical protein N008_02510 [Hymenobacter sp. APR13]